MSISDSFFIGMIKLVVYSIIFIGIKRLVASCVKDRNEKPTVRYERGLVMDSLTIFNLIVCF